ncbi:SET domain-containing protein, partial [Fistulina hepatica ATCC 64428]
SYRNDASKLSKEDKEYCFDLDGHEDLDNQTRISSSFTVNSKKIGNWTRFINHSCEPNLVIQSVVWEKIPEENKPFLVFVAKYDLEPFTELSIDY